MRHICILTSADGYLAIVVSLDPGSSNTLGGIHRASSLIIYQINNIEICRLNVLVLAGILFCKRFEVDLFLFFDFESL